MSPNPEKGRTERGADGTSRPQRSSEPASEAEVRAAETVFEEIPARSDANGGEREPEAARRILRLRHRAGLELLDRATGEPLDYPTPDFDQLPEGAQLPEVGRAEVTPELLRAAIMRNGCLLIRGGIDEGDVTRLVDGIDCAYAARHTQQRDGSSDGRHFEEFEPDPRFDLSFERGVIRGGDALLGADSPLVLFDVLDAFERAGLHRLAAEYLGESPAISVNKSLLRKASPKLFDAWHGPGGSKLSAWHQDGAFLGDVRALNAWLSLSHCGAEAPGLDIVPRRLETIVPTGTEGAVFDWSVSQAVAEDISGDAGVLRPAFEPGDVLLFDELFLHATAVEPGMTRTRYAVENWFFGPSGFPPGYAPLAI